MSIKRITDVWSDSPYDGTRLLIHLALADISHDDGRFFASQKDLAKKGRCTVEYVRKVINEMIEDGQIAIVTKGSSRGKATVYQLLKKEPPNSIGESKPEEEPRPPNSDTPNPPTLTLELPNSTPYHPSYTPVLSTTKDISQLFSNFWLVYPRRTAIGEAKKAFAKALKKAGYEEIMEGAMRYNSDPNRDPAFTAHASTWLNQERWGDDDLPGKSKPKGQSFLESFRQERQSERLALN